MRIHDVLQGSREWNILRAKHHTASEAPAMMGVSKYQSRDLLLKQKFTGVSEPIDFQKQRLFNKGHLAESEIRPHIEKIVGQELFPATGTVIIDDLHLLASFDGIIMDGDIIFEHKLWSEDLANAVKDDHLTDHYKWQLDQQLLVSGADKAIFVTSDGTPEKMVYCWYEPNQIRFKQLLAGWKQFNEDLANYQYVPEPELITADPVMDLPAVSIRVDGEIALVDNFNIFGEALNKYIDNINKEPETDQDFANLESAVKTLSKAEKALDAAEANALAQFSSIDEMQRTKALLHKTARDTRLIIEKLVKSQKELIRVKMIDKAQKEMDAHIMGLNAGFDDELMPEIKADFRKAISGKKTITSLQGAVNDERARAMTEASMIAEKIRVNLASFKIEAEGYTLLFHDLKPLLLKENSDFVLTIRDRVAKQKQQEADRLEAERERIRKEEAEKLQQEQAPEAQVQQIRSFRPGVDMSAPRVHPLPEDRPESGPVWVVHVTDKELAAQAIVRGAPHTDMDDLIINTDRLTEKAYKLNGNLSIPGIKITNEKAD